MFSRILSCLVLLAIFQVAVQAALPVYSEAALQAWWSSRPNPANYAEESANLKSLLARTQQEGKDDLGAVVTQPNFLGWLDLTCWLSLYPTSGEGFLTSPEGRATFAKLGADSNLRQLFLANLSAFDDAPKALEIFCRIAHAEPANCKRLPQLALAFALVWDQPFPKEWPHVYVDSQKLPVGDSDPVARFQAYCKIAQGLTIKPGEVRTFLLDPARLTTRDLMFVVDMPLDFKELDYILQIKLNDPTRLSGLFQQVPYDAARMNRGELMWGHPAYRLIDIGTKGGICADQAYFVAMAGKAQGIPTVLLFGQGTTGAHAWVGYEGGPGRWTLNVARYKEGNYASGRTYDPQTWQRLTDSQLAFLTREPTNAASALRGRLLMHWAQLNRETDVYPQLLGLARNAWPRSFDIWELQAKCLADRKMPPASCQAFWEHWSDTFREDRDMRFRGQSALLKLFETRANPVAAEKLRALMISESQHTRFDLAIRLAAAPIFDLINANQWPQAQQAFLDLLKKRAKETDGNLFYNLVQPFIEQAIQAGQREIATAALNTAKPLFQIIPLSTLAVDFKALEAGVQAK